MEHYFSRLQNAIRQYWKRPAVANYNGEVITYSQLAENILRFHLLFEKSGIVKGDKISICGKNSARWGVSFLSVNTYEAVVVPILADFHPDSVNYLVDHSESVLLFTDKEIFEKLDVTKMPRLKGIIDNTTYKLLFCRDENLQNAMLFIDEAFKTKYPDGVKPEDIVFNTDNGKDLALINYTSGSTGTPKGVMLRYECLSATIDFGQRYIPSNSEYTMVSMLPMAHMYGLTYEFLYPLCNGTSIHFLGKTPSPSLLLKAMKDIKPYLLITVPLVLEKIYKSSLKPALEKPLVKLLLKIPGLNKALYKKMREAMINALGGNIQMLIAGGAALNPEAEACFKKMGLPYTVGYGMTEAAPLLAYRDCRYYVPGSCGVAVDCAEVRIDSDDPIHKVGEIQAKGINICSGYFKNEEATKAAFTEDGFLRTGDLGIMDEDGNIFIKGRSKSMILSSNGQNIYPEEIEAVVNNEPYVIESVVVSRDGKLVALVYMDVDNAAKAGMVDMPAYLDKIQKDINSHMPVYSKIAKMEQVSVPFEKTPKMSIKRFLYS